MPLDGAVAILGGTGAVGRSVARIASRTHRVRIGSRDVHRAREVVESETGGRGEAMTLDLDTRFSLRRFMENSAVVINCSGPSCRLGSTAAEAAIEAGIGYVDPGGDEPLFELISKREAISSPLVVSAGMLPGLSGLVPRLAAQGFDSVEHITGYSGGTDIFSNAGAADFLASLSNGFGRGGSCIRAGAVAPSAPPAQPQITLPYSHAVYDLHAFISTEFSRTCRELGVENGDWYNLFAGRNALKVLGRVAAEHHILRSSNEPDPALVRDLVAASAADQAGYTRCFLIGIEIRGLRNESRDLASLIVRGESGADMTGAVAVSAARAILRGDVPAGVHFAAEILAPHAVLHDLKADLTGFTAAAIRGPLAAVEEGAL